MVRRLRKSEKSKKNRKNTRSIRQIFILFQMKTKFLRSTPSWQILSHRLSSNTSTHSWKRNCLCSLEIKRLWELTLFSQSYWLYQDCGWQLLRFSGLESPEVFNLMICIHPTQYITICNLAFSKPVEMLLQNSFNQSNNRTPHFSNGIRRQVVSLHKSTSLRTLHSK